MTGPRGWIGVDLDGTLAFYDDWRGGAHIGAPITLMVDRVKKWLADGECVCIVTARVATEDEHDLYVIREAIEAWCLEHVGQVLPITNKKDWGMREIWDDRAVQVIPNTGRRADGLD